MAGLEAMASPRWTRLTHALLKPLSGRGRERLANVLGMLRQVTSQESVTGSARPQIRREQARSLATVTLFLALGGWTCDLIVGLDFGSQLSWLGWILVVATAGLYATWVALALLFRRNHDTERLITRSIGVVIGLALAWAGLLAIMAAVAVGDQSRVVAAFCIAFVSTPIVSVPLSVALLFWLPVSVSGTLSLFYLLKPFDGYLFVCYLGYLSFTLSAIVYLNKMLVLRCIASMRLQQQHHLVELLLHDFEEVADEWLWETDRDLRLTRVSARLAQLTQRSVESLRGCTIFEVAGFSAAPKTSLVALRRAFRSRHPFRNVTVPVEIAGETRWWTITGRPIFNQGAEFNGYRGIGLDITDSRIAADRIAFMAKHDPLTGLPNRDWFGMQLRAACAKAVEAPFALFFLDLDRFKAVNDTLGHAAGDLLLVAVAERLVNVVRSPSSVSRFGGDEFAVLAYTSDASEIRTIAERLIDSISAPYVIRSHQARVGVSVGSIAVSEVGQTDIELMRSADVALYRAKKDGRGVWRPFDLAMDATSRQQFMFEADLRKAVENCDFWIAYQPVVDLTSFEIIYFEALLRWSHPIRGLVPPSDFIPMAEELGLICQLGEWVLSQACLDAAGWPDPVGVAVNVSAIQLVAADLVDIVDRALLQSGLNSRRLSLEITESAFLKPDSDANSVLDQFRRRSIKIVLDDFGTGYSSLAYLTRFRLDGLKIDASLVADMSRNAGGTTIVKSIAMLGEELGIDSVGEGVETMEQASRLRMLRVTRGQGYLLGAPIRARDVPGYLAGDGQPAALRRRSLDDTQLARLSYRTLSREADPAAGLSAGGRKGVEGNQSVGVAHAG